VTLRINKYPSVVYFLEPLLYGSWACAIAHLYKLIAVFIALAYGAILSQIPAEHFKDFNNYLVYAEQSWFILLGRIESGVLATLSNEPVWLLINAVLGASLSSENVVRLLIFTSATMVSWVVLSNYPRHFGWLLVFLILPAVVKNHLIHLRQGLAIAFFLWAWFSPRHITRWLLMCITPFVHVSFFFVLPILWVAKSMTFIGFGAVLRTIVFVGMGIATGIGLAWLALLLGARQAEVYNLATIHVSGFGFAFWTIIFGIMFFEGRHFLREHVFAIGMIVFYLSTYWLIEVTARIFESGLLLVLLAGLMLSGWRRIGFLTAVLTFCVLTWLTRLSQPAMGFGIG
jgi:hypothetical protein